MGYDRPWIRLSVALGLTLVLILVWLLAVPGATPRDPFRMMAFVLGFPWLIALLVVRPVRVGRALLAVYGGGPGEDPAVTHVLEFVGGLTIAAGAIGAVGAHFAFLEAGLHVEDPGLYVAGPVAASMMPPAFCLIVRVVLLEPLIRALRRQHGIQAPDHSRSLRILCTTGKIAAVVVATVLIVELGPVLLGLGLTREKKPKVFDTSMDMVFTPAGAEARGAKPADPAPGEGKTTGTPIQIQLSRSGSITLCRVDGQTLTAQPGREDELLARLRWMMSGENRSAFEGRPIQIRMEPGSLFRDLVGAMDACIRVRDEWMSDGEGRTGLDVRVVVGVKEPTGFVFQVRIVQDARGRGELVLLELPECSTAEPPWPEE